MLIWRAAWMADASGAYERAWMQHPLERLRHSFDEMVSPAHAETTLARWASFGRRRVPNWLKLRMPQNVAAVLHIRQCMRYYQVPYTSLISNANALLPFCILYVYR